ncbi:MAG: peptidylprolyl isomerase, partial [Sphingopyxis sp.]
MKYSAFLAGGALAVAAVMLHGWDGGAAMGAARPQVAPSTLTPSEVVAAAPASDWVAIAPQDLIVMQLAADGAGRARSVVIELMPGPFSAGWVRNIRILAAAHWWDGLSINRVQDNYVTQWGDALGDEPDRVKSLPPGLATNAAA